MLSGPQLVALPLGDHQVLPGQLGQGPLDLPEGEPQPLGQGAGGGGDVVGEVFQNLLPGEFLPGKGPVGEGEGEVGALCVGGLGQYRGLPPLLGPEGIDPPQPPPGAGGQLQQGEEGHQPPVSRVASGALAGLVRVHPQQAAVGHGELPRRAENGPPRLK